MRGSGTGASGILPFLGKDDENGGFPGAHHLSWRWEERWGAACRGWLSVLTVMGSPQTMAWVLDSERRW